MSFNTNQRPFLWFSFLAVLAWNLAIIAAPFWAASALKPLNYAAALMYFFFDPVCHQLPGRSLFLSGLPMPVCARCFFIYLAGLFVLAIPLIRGQVKAWPVKTYLITGAFVVIEISLEKLDIYQNWTGLRAVSGFILGVIIFRLLLEGTGTEIFKRRKDC